jgi:glutamate dehydrogenase
MLSPIPTSKIEIIEDISDLAKTKDLKGLIGKLYSSVSAEDLSKFDIRYLFDVAEEGLSLLKDRRNDRFKVRYIQSENHQQNSVIQVINDDVPFLIDSLCNELKRRQIDILLIVHSMISIERDAVGTFKKLDEDGKNEYLIQIHLLNRLSEDQVKDLIFKFEIILDAVNLAVADWKEMRTVMTNSSFALKQAKGSHDSQINDESSAFLDWLINNNFVFLGSVKIESIINPRIIDPKGIMKVPYYELLEPPYLNEILDSEIVFVRKWDMRSIVHRTAHMDVIVVKTFDDHGKCKGFYLFFGLFTSTVYYQSVRGIPLVRQKVNSAISHYGYPESSHNCKEFITALESFPRGELLQMSSNELYETASGIVELTLMPRVKVFAREDKSKKFISFMIYIPEKRFSTETRELIEAIVCKALNGTVSKRYIQFGEASLARIQLIIKLSGAKISREYKNEIETKILQAVSVWSEDLYASLGKKYSQKLVANFSKDTKMLSILDTRLQLADQKQCMMSF